MEGRPVRSSYSSFVIIATFLSLTAVVSSSQGQAPPEVVLLVQPEPHYYVTKYQPAKLTCEASGATSIAFICLGSPVLPRDIHTLHEGEGRGVVRTSLHVSLQDVEGARGAGVEEYWCQCTAQDQRHFLAATSRRTVISPADMETDALAGVPVSRQSGVRAHRDTAKPRIRREVEEPVFSEQPPMKIYITPNQPIQIVCAVEGARRMTVRCNNQRIDPIKLVTESDTETKYIRNEFTLTYPEVENYLNSFPGSQHKCECVAWYHDPTHPRRWGSVVTEGGEVYLAHLDEKFVEQPSDVTAQDGTAARLQCGAPEGKPRPKVVWVFEQQRLEPEVDSRYMVSEEGTLTINDVDYSDEGRYYCIAENSMGIRQSEVATLTVSAEPVTKAVEPSPSPTPGYMPMFPAMIPDTPQFTKDLDPVYFLDHQQEAHLTCTVVSADTLTYRCMQNRLNEDEQDIDMQMDRGSGKRLLTASTVVRLAAMKSVEGNYTCQCVAWYIQDGTWRHNLSSSAVIRPSYIDSVFFYEPQGGLYYTGDSAEFACNPPGGQPTPLITWMKDGETLDTEADDNFELVHGGGLIIQEVRPQDAGEYVCVAANPAGKRKSSPAELEVYVVPDSSTVEPFSTGKATDGPGGWSSTDVGGVSSSPKDVPELSTTRTGRIVPFFALDPVNVTYVVDREAARLTCAFVEATRLVFLCNGKRVGDDKELDAFKVVDPGTGYVFLEKSIMIGYQDLESFEGSGNFTCHCRAYYPGDGAELWQFVASHDTVVMLAYLNTVFAEEPVQQFVELGVSTELVCRPPQGQPPPVVYWMRDGYHVTDTNNMWVTAEGSLVFDQVTRDDGGNYTCVAENILGARRSNTVPLNVVDRGVIVTTEDSIVDPEPEGEGTPDPEGEGEGESEGEGGESWENVPQFVAEPESNYYIIRSRPVSITCQAIGTEQINFNCNGESIPQYRVQYQDLQVEEYDDDVMTASIDISREEVENYNNQHDGNDFHCQCFARYTDPGHSDHQYVASTSGYVEVAYLKKMFRREPFNITVNEGEFVSLPCEAPEGHPMPEVNWILNGVSLSSGIPTSDNAYVIKSAGSDDAGIYECVATNQANTRRSRPGSVHVMVGGTLITGQPMTEGPEPEGETETTTSDYDVSWTTGPMSPEQNCMSIIQSCTAVMPRELSGPGSPGCRNAMRYKECVGRFLEECEGVLNKESLDAADSTRKAVEKACGGSAAGGGGGGGGGSGRVCQELMDCQSEYSNQQVPNADAETMPMEILCEGIHSFLRCAESAADTCGIPQDNPDTSLSDLAEWFEDYCQRVVNQEWAKQCPSFSQCDLPIEQTTILSNIVQASLWCPYVEETMQCTRQAVSDCGVGGVEEDLYALEDLAQMTCNPSAGGGSEKDGDSEEGGEGEAEGESDGSDEQSSDTEDAGILRARIHVSDLTTVCCAAVDDVEIEWLLLGDGVVHLYTWRLVSLLLGDGVVHLYTWRIVCPVSLLLGDGVVHLYTWRLVSLLLGDGVVHLYTWRLVCPVSLLLGDGVVHLYTWRLVSLLLGDGVVHLYTWRLVCAASRLIGPILASVVDLSSPD
ncbi:hypothetical protein ACOMHN_026373 [Nucella lapillus]